MGLPAVELVPIFVALFLAASALWVYQDDSRRVQRGRGVYFSVGSLELSTPGVWAGCCLVLWVLAMPLYLTCRKVS
jgi:hypothetical protein